MRGGAAGSRRARRARAARPRGAADHFGDLLDAEVDGDLDHDDVKASSDQDSDDEEYLELDHGGA